MFENRQEAGRLLAEKLLRYEGASGVLVLSIPRGGVVIGKIISEKLQKPHGIINAKKIPTPGQPELAAGAFIAEDIKKFGETPDVGGKKVILVDDGIATGATVEAAVNYLKKRNAEKIILAIPVAPKDTVEKLKKEVDEIIVLETPEDFSSVGQFYRDFPQVSDAEVLDLLQNS